MNREVIGRGTWIDKIASTIISREKDIGSPLKSVLVESGLGASGFPHIGSLGDAVFPAYW
jgi:Lysyl-tRNA synthetase (class I)